MYMLTFMYTELLVTGSSTVRRWLPPEMEEDRAVTKSSVMSWRIAEVLLLLLLFADVVGSGVVQAEKMRPAVMLPPTRSAFETEGGPEANRSSSRCEGQHHRNECSRPTIFDYIGPRTSDMADLA